MSKKTEKFDELLAMHPPEVQDWVTKMDRLLTATCKSAVDNKGNFTYTSKESSKIVCRIAMGEPFCTVRPNTINVTDLHTSIPENMLEIMRNARGCGGCAKKNPNFVQCKHGGPYRFSHNGEQFESCRFVGFNFSIDNAGDRSILEKWITEELLSTKSHKTTG